MTDISVLDLLGPICVDSDDAARLCHVALEILNRGDAVRLDFSGVTTLTGGFLSVVIGGFYAFFSKCDLDQRFSWTGLDTIHEDVLRIVQEHAIRFYSFTPAQQEALLASEARLVGE